MSAPTSIVKLRKQQIKAHDLAEVLTEAGATAADLDGFADVQWRLATALSNERHAARNGYRHDQPSVETRSYVQQLMQSREDSAAVHEADPFAAILRAEGRE